MGDPLWKEIFSRRKFSLERHSLLEDILPRKGSSLGRWSIPSRKRYPLEKILSSKRREDLSPPFSRAYNQRHLESTAVLRQEPKATLELSTVFNTGTQIGMSLHSKAPRITREPGRIVQHGASKRATTRASRFTVQSSSAKKPRGETLHARNIEPEGRCNERTPTDIHQSREGFRETRGTVPYT